MKGQAWVGSKVDVCKLVFVLATEINQYENKYEDLWWEYFLSTT